MNQFEASFIEDYEYINKQMTQSTEEVAVLFSYFFHSVCATKRAIERLQEIYEKKSIEEREALRENEQWIPFEELCEKYPFSAKSNKYDFIRYAPDNQDYLKKISEKEFLFNPKNLIKFISENRKRFPIFHARLRRNNFFGFLD